MCTKTELLQSSHIHTCSNCDELVGHTDTHESCVQALSPDWQQQQTPQQQQSQEQQLQQQQQQQLRAAEVGPSSKQGGAEGAAAAGAEHRGTASVGPSAMEVDNSATAAADSIASADKEGAQGREGQQQQHQGSTQQQQQPSQQQKARHRGGPQDREVHAATQQALLHSLVHPGLCVFMQLGIHRYV